MDATRQIDVLYLNNAHCFAFSTQSKAEPVTYDNIASAQQENIPITVASINIECN